MCAYMCMVWLEVSVVALVLCQNLFHTSFAPFSRETNVDCDEALEKILAATNKYVKRCLSSIFQLFSLLYSFIQSITASTSLSLSQQYFSTYLRLYTSVSKVWASRTCNQTRA